MSFYLRSLQRATLAGDSRAPVALQRSCACAENNATCPRCAAQSQPLQRFATEPGRESAQALPAPVNEVLHSPGAPLPAPLRAGMESHFDHDFSGVRIHADDRARQSAMGVDARAYTVGSDIVLGDEGLDLASAAGRRLIGHELAHVVQQSHGGVAAGIDPDPALEREARQAGNAVAERRSAPITLAAKHGLHRDPQTPTVPTTAQQSPQESYLDDPELASIYYHDGDYAYVTTTTTVDDVPVAEQDRSYSVGRETDTAVEDAAKIYRAAVANPFGTTPVVIDGEVTMVKGVGSSNEGDLIGNEIIEMHDLATEAEKSRRAGLSNPQTFKTFAKHYEKEHGTTEGAERAFFAYRDAESEKLFEGYRRIDAAAGVVNFLAEKTIEIVASGFDPIPVFVAPALGKGMELGIKAGGGNEDIANLAGGLTEMAVGMGNPADMTVTQALAPVVGKATEYAAGKLGFSDDDAGLAGMLGQFAFHGVASHKSGREPSLRERMRAGMDPTRIAGPGGGALHAEQHAGDPHSAAHTAARVHADDTPPAVPASPKADAAHPHSDAAHKPLADPVPVGGGHHTQVTEQGVEMCSPHPCPTLRRTYGKELAAHPEIQKKLDQLDAYSKVAARQEKAGKPDKALVARINREAAEVQQKLAAIRSGGARPKAKNLPRIPLAPAKGVPALRPTGAAGGRAAHPSAAVPAKGARPARRVTKLPADDASFKGLVDTDAMGKDPKIIDRLSRAREHDIGGYHEMTGQGKYGRVGDKLDADEALQNAYIRKQKGVKRNSPATRDNPAIALPPKQHKRIKNLKKPQMKGLSPHQVLERHLAQMKDMVPDYVINTLRKMSQAFIGRGLK